MIQLGALNYAAQYPRLWAYRPPLNQERQAFALAAAKAAEKAAEEVAETWKGDEPQPVGPEGNPLFMPAASWFVTSTDGRRAIWRTWLVDNWLIDWKAAQPGGAKVAAEVRDQSAKRLEKGTQQMQTSLLPTWAWWAIGAGGAFILWRATR